MKYIVETPKSVEQAVADLQAAVQGHTSTIFPKTGGSPADASGSRFRPAAQL